MGLFWGSEDAAKVDQKNERKRLEEKDPRRKPLKVMLIASGYGGEASDEFAFMFRDMYQQVCETRNLMGHLVKENQELRARVEHLEQPAVAEERLNHRAI